MKKLFGFVLVMALGIIIILSLQANPEFPAFGDVDLSDRISIRFIERDAMGDILYGITENLESGAANIVTAIVVDHGHLTPGGGFPGGTMIASSILLLYLADDQFRSKVKTFKWIEGLAGSFYVILGIIGLLVSGYFLKNILPNGVIGDLLSSGMIPIVYMLIGLKVGSEIAGVIDHFLSEEETI